MICDMTNDGVSMHVGPYYNAVCTMTKSIENLQRCLQDIYLTWDVVVDKVGHGKEGARGIQEVHVQEGHERNP